MPPTSTVTLPVIPADVAAFAAEHGVSDYLPAVLEMTRHLFPAAPITMQVVEDAEWADDRYIVLEVPAEGMRADQMVADQHEWSDRLFKHCPPTHVHLFCLRML